MSVNFRQLKAIEKINKQRILNICSVDEESGIYILTREDSGFKYAYIGQAKHLLTRLANHLSGYQHIDLSIKNHGFKNIENPNGWEVAILHFPENELDLQEQKFIKIYANSGFQLRNKTAGGQSEGKVVIDEIRPAKGYHDGLKQGYKNARKFTQKLFEKNLCFNCQGNKVPSKNQEKAKLKFEEFLKVEDENAEV